MISKRYLSLHTSLIIIGLSCVFSLWGTDAAQASQTLDVADFGAHGDASHDDTAAIQAALDKAGDDDSSVFLPSGTYRVSRSGSNYALRIPSGVTLYGAGDSSVIRLAPAQGAGIRVVAAKDATNVRLESLRVDGNDAAQGVWDEQNHGVFLTNVSNAVIRRVTVENVAGDGIYLHNRTSAIVENCTLIAGADPRIGINFSGAVDTVIRHNYMEGWDWALKAELNQDAPQAERILVYGNLGVRLKDGGLALNGHASGSFVWNVAIAGNRLQSEGTRSIWLKGARGIQLVGNVIEGGGAGVHVVADLLDTDIRSNDFVDQGAGVAIREASDYGASSGITVRDNLFRQASYAAAVSTPGAVAGLRVTGNQLQRSGSVALHNGNLALAPVILEDNIVGEPAAALPITPDNVDPDQLGVGLRIMADLPSLGLPDSYLFADLARSHPWSGAVEYLVDQGVIDGYSDGRFGISDPVKRAQLAKMASISFGLHTDAVDDGPSPFLDVPADGASYPFDFIDEAASRGFIYGYPDGTFDPFGDISRVQLVRILVRASGDNLAEPPNDWLTQFADVPAADRPYVDAAAYNGIVNGRSATQFDPYGRATRGHVAVMLHRLLSR